MVQQPDRMSRGFAISVLKNRGYAFKTSSDTNRLEQLVDRAERGLISYEKRTIAQLRQFCVTRKIPIPKGSRALHLIAILENADDNARFEGFSDLPAELRVRIYEILFQDTYEPYRFICPLDEPEVARSSRLLREESLSIFYDMVRFPIATYIAPYVERLRIDHGRRKSPCREAAFLISKEEAIKSFQARVPETILSQFNKISVDGWIPDSPRDTHYGHWAWEIDLENKGKKPVIRCATRPIPMFSAPTPRERQPGKPTAFSKRSGVLHDRAAMMLHSILDKMAAREGGMKLTREDVKAFAGVLQSIAY